MSAASLCVLTLFSSGKSRADLAPELRGPCHPAFSPLHFSVGERQRLEHLSHTALIAVLVILRVPVRERSLLTPVAAFLIFASF